MSLFSCSPFHPLSFLINGAVLLSLICIHPVLNKDKPVQQSQEQNTITQGNKANNTGSSEQHLLKHARLDPGNKANNTDKFKSKDDDYSTSST
jgi:hypothetical protein